MYKVDGATRAQITDNGAECDTDEDNAPHDLLTALQAYWGDAPEFNFTTGGAGGVPITGVISSSCYFAAAAGIQAGARNIGARTPSVSGDGRFVVFTTNWDAATALGAHEDPQAREQHRLHHLRHLPPPPPTASADARGDGARVPVRLAARRDDARRLASAL